MLVSLLVLGLLLPSVASAKRVSLGGSVSFTTDGSSLTNQLGVTSVITNSGLEKTITQLLPLPGHLYTLPFFVNKDLEQNNQGDLDTILILLNATDAALPVTVTIRGVDGGTISTVSLNLAARETRAIFLSRVLP